MTHRNVSYEQEGEKMCSYRVRLFTFHTNAEKEELDRRDRESYSLQRNQEFGRLKGNELFFNFAYVSSILDCFFFFFFTNR